MIEPLLKTFEKVLAFANLQWTNNHQFVSEGSEGELMAAYTHYTYVRSNKSFMITDHQGIHAQL
jgi:hypothetical protein